MDILFKNGRIIDPLSRLDEVKDILISNGRIVFIDKEIKPKREYRIIDIKDEIVIPALLDLHTHLRTPGREDEETLFSGALAALKGGFTRICCMPNTEPPIDNAGLVEFIKNKNRQNNIIDIFPVGAVTKAREGKELTEMYDLKQAGAVAFSDDGLPVLDSYIMRKALEYANMLNMPVISHCEDINLSGKGQINEGYISTTLGLPGIPDEVESSMVARDIFLSKLTGAHLHIAHISCQESIQLIRAAKSQGINVTCETCPHYFSLTEESVLNFDTNAKVSPPLRTQQDVDAIKEAISDGTIDIITSDHAPHAVQEKELEFDKAPFGMIGLETALSLTVTNLLKSKMLDWGRLVEIMSINPARVINKKPFTIKEEEIANLTVIKMQEWIPKKDNLYSLSYNTPFLDKPVMGFIDYVVSKGKLSVEKGEVNLYKEV